MPIWILANPFNEKLTSKLSCLLIIFLTFVNIQKMKPAEEYILSQPEPFRSILLHIQILIETSFPEVELQFKWKIPFYYLDNKPFCYLNPSKKKVL